MRHLRMLGLCLAAMFAFGALVSTAAWATPPAEFGKCEAKPAPKTEAENPGPAYTEAKCLKASKETVKGAEIGKSKPKVYEKLGNGKYEWVPLASPVTQLGAGVKGKLSSAVRACAAKENTEACEKAGFVTVASKVECANEESETTIENATKVLAFVKFTGCSTNKGKVECGNTGEALKPWESKEIVDYPAAGEPGLIAAKKVGVALTSPAALAAYLHSIDPLIPENPESEAATFVCAGIGEIHVGVDPQNVGESKPVYAGTGHDLIIGEVKPADKMGYISTSTYAVNANDEQKVSSFEGGPTLGLEMFLNNPLTPTESSLWSHAGETIKVTNTSVNYGEWNSTKTIVPEEIELRE